jgi:hypothetical protein
VEIRWPCRLIRAAGRHYARHAGRLCFWSSATRVRLQSPIGPDSFHTQPCGFGCGFAHRWIAQNGDLPGADFPSEQRTGQQVLIPGSAALLPSGRVGRHGFQLCSPSLPEASPPPFHPTSRRGRCINHSGCTRRPHIVVVQ